MGRSSCETVSQEMHKHTQCGLGPTSRSLSEETALMGIQVGVAHTHRREGQAESNSGLSFEHLYEIEADSPAC